MSRRGFASVVVAVSLMVSAHALAQPSANVDDYVLFAGGTLKTKGLTVADGGIGVNDAGGRLICRGALTAPSSMVAADRVRLDKTPGNTVVQQLFANIVEIGGTATPFSPPIVADVATACGFPAPFPVCAPGMDVDVPAGTTMNLAPGVYGKVRVHGSLLAAGVLVLNGGSYVVCDVKASRTAQLRVQTPTTLAVVGKVSLGPSAFFGPEAGSGLVASDIRLYANGPIVKLARQSYSEARLCAPSAKLKVSRGGTHIGSYVASYIRTQEVTLALGSPSGAFL
jgi:hypothetical protein